MACHFHWLHLAPRQILYYVATTDAFCEGLESEDQACQHPQGGGVVGVVFASDDACTRKKSLKQIYDGQTWHLSVSPATVVLTLLKQLIRLKTHCQKCEEGGALISQEFKKIFNCKLFVLSGAACLNAFADSSIDSEM
jgi:hypothetical protein